MEARPIYALKAVRFLRIGRILRKLLRKGKKLLETKKVAQNMKSCQKVAEQLVESPTQK